MISPATGSAKSQNVIHFKGEGNALFGGPGSAKRHRMNGPGSLQSGGPDADYPSGLARSSSPLVGGGGPGGAALSPPPLPVTVAAADRLFPPGMRSTSMDNNSENNNKVRFGFRVDTGSGSRKHPSHSSNQLCE